MATAGNGATQWNVLIGPDSLRPPKSKGPERGLTAVGTADADMEPDGPNTARGPHHT